MKAVVFHGVGDIRLENAPEPKIKDKTDAIVRLTASAICGTDLHFVRGTVSGMVPGTILGHEGVGIVEEVGSDVRDLKIGDRVVIPSTIACGYCAYCREGYYAMCDNANPNGKRAGAAFFGGPKTSGPFNGLQAEYARIPFANVGPVKIPDEVTDDQAILLSDILPTGYFGAKLAEIKAGNTVAVFGCGPVGLFSIMSAKHMGAGLIFAVDHVDSRLEMAAKLGAETINFEKEHPVEKILDMTGGIGVDRVIDAVGVDAIMPHHGPAVKIADHKKDLYRQEVKQVAPKSTAKGSAWTPGDAPSIVFEWAVDSIAKAGTLLVIGVYPETMNFFPIGSALKRSLTIKAGDCNHRAFIPILLEMVASGAIHPEKIISQSQPLASAIDAYKAFDTHQPGWIKIELKPQKIPASV